MTCRSCSRFVTCAVLVWLTVPAFGQDLLQPEAPPAGETTETPVEASVLSREARMALLLEGHRAYEEGDFARAAAAYREIARSGVVNGDLQYNLGNALIREGLVGEAVAAYLRAESLLPRDQDVQANLQFARSQALDELEPPRAAPWVRTLAFWHFSLSRAELIQLALLCNLALWVAMAFRARFPDAEPLRWLAGASLVLTVLFGGSALWRVALPEQIAVVTAAEAKARAGLEDDATVRFELHPGSEVRAVEQRDAQVRVALPTGEQGWIRNDEAVLVVR